MADTSEENFTAAMKAAVQERGTDWIYPSFDTEYTGGGGCRYRTLHGEPACIVGLALHKLGLLDSPAVGEGQSASRVLMLLGYTGDVLGAADEAQMAQDVGAPWGRALELYMHRLGAKAVA